MTKPRLLDLFCCQGGAAMGYSRAGFDVVGVDIVAQPRYPFPFVQMDALEALRVLLAGGCIVDKQGREWYLSDFAAVHASPPCEFDTGLKALAIARNGSYPDHLNLIPAAQAALDKFDKPYVIENVPNARKWLRNPVMLCGLHFGLKVYRHRWFEIKPFMLAPAHQSHRDSTPSVGNGVSPKGFISVGGTGGVRGMNEAQIVDKWQSAMGMDWADRYGMSKAIPPAYTEFIGRHLLAALEMAVTP